MADEQSQEQRSAEQSQDQGSAKQNEPSKKRSRGPSKGIQSSTPMFLEFNAFDLPYQDWEAAYGKQIGACAKRIDINFNEYSKIDKVDKDNLWEETKV